MQECTTWRCRLNAPFDWTLAQAFLATVEGGSYSEAGRTLGVAQSTIGRQVAALEAELGVTLFERVGNRMEPTQAGARLVDPIRAMRAAADRVRLVAEGAATDVEGVVRVTASESVTAHVLPPVVLALRERHPALRLDLVASDSVQDLIRREADIAVRHVRPEHSELVARRLRTRRARFYATSSHLEHHGRPTTPEALATHPLIGWADREAFAAGLRHQGVPATADTCVAVASSHLAQWALCLAGVGVAVMDEDVGDADPRVERVSADLPVWEVPVWLVCHRELRTSRRIRVVYDALAEALG